MTLYSLLLRVLLIVALSLNGYAAAAMSVSGAHAMHAAPDRAVALAATGSAADDASSDCHGRERATDSAPALAPESPAPDRGPPTDDCCGKALCQCDCLQAAAIVRIALPLPAPLAAARPAPAPDTVAPDAGSNRLIRPPIA
ncbi:CopL family metal-binding regulatory protein [Lysobacter firmicutimachus]|uniref:CopL family metal-binding regulatory protein n=1 Tax=Lysobacter firmicutimachus TaxID=1792846 RepID=A0AAU8MSR9_9GAMM